MLARSGLVGKKSSWPYLEPSEAIFPWTEKIQKMPKFCLFFLGGHDMAWTRRHATLWHDTTRNLLARKILTSHDNATFGTRHATWYQDTIPPPRVDSSKGPNRVNRAHWPTKENVHVFCISILVFGPLQGLAETTNLATKGREQHGPTREFWQFVWHSLELFSSWRNDLQWPPMGPGSFFFVFFGQSRPCWHFGLHRF